MAKKPTTRTRPKTQHNNKQMDRNTNTRRNKTRPRTTPTPTSSRPNTKPPTNIEKLPNRRKNINALRPNQLPTCHSANTKIQILPNMRHSGGIMDAVEIEIAKERLLSKVEKTDSCWLWRGGFNSRKYGKMYADKKSWLAHRLSFTLFNGPIPDGLHVCHSCDVPACVNPDHLWVGTAKDNIRDAVDKGHFKRTKKTHCRKGHDYSVAGVYYRVRTNGSVYRSCALCSKILSKNSRLKAKQRSGSGGSMDRATDF